MRNLKDALLDRYGDEGADTFDRYYAQIEYTILWCIRLLNREYSVCEIYPETAEDVVIVRPGKVELHQIKTRDESQGTWSTAELLPILCKLYHNRHAFPSERYEFHFVSDGRADTTTQLKKDRKPRPAYGALYRLRALLDVQHASLPLSPDEQKEFGDLEAVLVPQIQSLILSEHNEVVTEEEARALLGSTWIETNSTDLRTALGKYSTR